MSRSPLPTTPLERRPLVAAAARVAVAGATGYTGQELLRLLARHPARRADGRDVVGPPSASARRAAGARARVGRPIAPLVAPTTLARDADVVFLALPDGAAAELAPALVDAGVRVIDLSGAFRLRDAAVRGRGGIRKRTSCRRASPTA